MSILGSVISVGGALLGGALQSKANRKAAEQNYALSRQGIQEQNEYNNPANVRARAESAGFNPLLFVGPGVGEQTSAASATVAPSVMGQAVANAALLAADEADKSDNRVKQVAALEAENKALKEKVNKQSLSPRVAGIFGVGGVPMDTSGGSGYISGPLHHSPRPIAAPVTVDWNQRREGMTQVFDTLTGKWSYVQSGIANRLGLKDGDFWLAEDNEAVYGEVLSSAVTAPALATGVFNRGSVTYYGGPGPVPPSIGEPRFDRSKEKETAPSKKSPFKADDFWTYGSD